MVFNIHCEVALTQRAHNRLSGPHKGRKLPRIDFFEWTLEGCSTPLGIS